ncbi:MAG: thioredoxin domain-containing protein, partial [Verrucomicrobiae bacterium]|nr:thioredoxin domain-containing protein [Verrucomicrobiae bacterium]
WLVPHFEKMLYDQALYVIASLEAYEVTGKEEHARNVREVLSYVSRDLTSETGGFYSAEDADSEGEEGKFYTWTNSEVLEVLGTGDGGLFLTTYRFQEEGNFQDEATRAKNGTNIPHLRADLTDEERVRLEPMRQKLWERRETRIHPQKDDKILTDWNGLMISAYARAAQVLGDDSYGEVAKKAADFLLSSLTRDDGRLLKRYRQGEAGLTAHLEDYAFFIRGLLDLYETTFDVGYFERALAFQKVLDEHFWDEKEGGYFTTANDSEVLIVRAKKLYGGAIPSGNAVSLGNLARLHRMTGDPAHAERAGNLIRAFSGEIAGQPAAYPETLCGLDFFFGPTREIVISGQAGSPDTIEMIKALRKGFRPNQVVLLRTSENAEKLALLAPYTATQTSVNGKATAYICRDFACEAPTTDPAKMLELLAK